MITQDRAIVDGHARFELARLQGRLTLQCIEYEMTEAESLQCLLERHLRSNGLNAFSRVLLALDLEPWFREKARSNQRVGGQSKGSSKLTEAERTDVRKQIAAAAGVSVGNISKVKQVTMTAHPELSQALRSGEISIHRAWKWSKSTPEKQKEELRQYRVTRLIRHTNRKLISRHRTNPASTVTDLGSLLRRLSQLEGSEANSICVVVLKGRDLGRTVVVTEQLLRGNSDIAGKDTYALPAAP